MAPFCKAVSVSKVPALQQESYVTTLTNISDVYTGLIDPDWAVGSVSNGGYVLALILESCIRHQSKTEHVDPLHLTAHFLRSTLVGSFEVHVRTLKTGKGLTNVIAELSQQGITKVTTHVIFGVNGPSPSDPIQFTLPTTSSYARRIPLYSHPSNPPAAKPMREPWKFKGHVQLIEDTETLLKNEPDSSTRTTNSTVGGGGLEWAGWFEFNDKEDKITSPAVAFLADIFMNIPMLLPPSEKPKLKTSWFPTITMSIEFKAPIPPPSSKHAARTVGLYSSGRFLENPSSRNEAYVEVWTAPCALGEGAPVDGWRKDQVCLAIATQMALMVPMEVNKRQAKEPILDAAKL